MEEAAVSYPAAFLLPPGTTVEPCPGRYAREIQPDALRQVVVTADDAAPAMPQFGGWLIHYIGVLAGEPTSREGDGPDLTGYTMLWPVRVVVRHPQRRGWVEWTRGGRLAIQDVADAPDADVRALAEARRLMQEVVAPVRGRRPGREYTSDEFLAGFRKALRYMKQNQYKRITHELVAGVMRDQIAMPMVKSTLQEYLKAEGLDFARVKADWHAGRI